MHWCITFSTCTIYLLKPWLLLFGIIISVTLLPKAPLKGLTPPSIQTDTDNCTTNTVFLILCSLDKYFSYYNSRDKNASTMAGCSHDLELIFFQVSSIELNHTMQGAT